MTPTRITVGAEVVVHGLRPDEMRAVSELLSYPNPEFVRREKAGSWVGNIDPKIRACRTDKGSLVCPRGAFHTVRRKLAELGREGVIEPGTTFVPLREGVPFLAPDAASGAPRLYQLEAEERLLRQVQGYVVLPCGAGKTFVGARALIRSGQAALVLCHTGDLLDQWRDAIYRASGTPPRLIGDEHSGDFRPARPREVVAALIQSVQAAGPKALGLLRSVGAVLVDEAHRAPCAGYVDLLAKCPARYRWGLTATPDRADGLGFLLGYHVGPELYRKTPRELAAEGHLRLPRAVLVRTGWTAGEDVRDRTGRLEWHKTVAGFSTDPKRDAVICDLAAACVESGRTTLVLVHRVDHAGRIAAQLRKRGIAAEAVTGQTDRGHRKRRINDARRGRVDCLVATQLADEGLDVPNLAALVTAAPQRAEGRALQRLGRLTRPGTDKLAPIAFDLVDGGLEHQARARAAAYAREYDAEPGRSIDLAAALVMLRGLDAEDVLGVAL